MSCIDPCKNDIGIPGMGAISAAGGNGGNGGKGGMAKLDIGGMAKLDIGGSAPSSFEFMSKSKNGLLVVPNAPNGEGVVPKAPNAIGAGPGAGAPKLLKPMYGMVVVAIGIGTPGINVGAKGPNGLTSPGKRSGKG